MIDLPVLEPLEEQGEVENAEKVLWVATHTLRGQKVMRVERNGVQEYYYETGDKAVKGKEKYYPISTTEAKAARAALDTKSLANDMDLADLLTRAELDEFIEKTENPDPVFMDVEFSPELIGLCVEAVKYSRASDIGGNTAVMIDKKTVKLSVYKGSKEGGCRHYLVPLPDKITVRVSVIEW